MPARRKPLTPNAPEPSHEAALSAILPFLPEIQPIIAAIREAHGIIPPTNLRELRENLRRHPIHPVEQDLMKAFRRIDWPEDLSHITTLLNPALSKSGTLYGVIPLPKQDSTALRLSYRGSEATEESPTGDAQGQRLQPPR